MKLQRLRGTHFRTSYKSTITLFLHTFIEENMDKSNTTRYSRYYLQGKKTTKQFSSLKCLLGPNSTCWQTWQQTVVTSSVPSSWTRWGRVNPLNLVGFHTPQKRQILMSNLLVSANLNQWKVHGRTEKSMLISDQSNVMVHRCQEISVTHSCTICIIFHLLSLTHSNKIISAAVSWVGVPWGLGFHYQFWWLNAFNLQFTSRQSIQWGIIQ